VSDNSNNSVLSVSSMSPKKILIADNDLIALRLLRVALSDWGYEVITCADGNEAWDALQNNDISVALLDWVMPEIDGLELCRRLRPHKTENYTYVIILSANSSLDDMIKALDAGADDYMYKPYDLEELHSRMKAGERIVKLESSLANKILELETALDEVRQLKELLPICMYCKKIRDDGDYWHQVESYIHERTGVGFSHGICPDCVDNVVKPEIEALTKKIKDSG
jgi:sigma-B regulation protein RsbU (phosphoserine phosphatase)